MAQYYSKGNKAQKQKTAAKYGMQVRERRAGESEFQYFKSLAKQADQRLVRLERYAEEPGFKNVTSWAYERAMRDIKENNPFARRFNQLAGIVKNKDGSLDINSLRGVINDLKTFLESPSSTKRGIQKVYQERANTINEKYGTSFSWEEMGRYFDRGIHEKYDKMLGDSKTKLRVIGILQQLKGMKPEDIQKFKDNDLQLSDKSEVAQEIARNLLNQGIDYNTLIGK